MAPEVLRGRGYSFPADWWSAGVLLHELMTGCTPFQFDSLQELFELLRDPALEVKLDPPKTARAAPSSQPSAGPPTGVAREAGGIESAAARDLVERLLVADVSARLGGKVDTLRSHPFFESIDWVKLEAKEGPAPFTIAPQQQQQNLEGGAMAALPEGQSSLFQYFDVEAGAAGGASLSSDAAAPVAEGGGDQTVADGGEV